MNQSLAYNTIVSKLQDANEVDLVATLLLTTEIEIQDNAVKHVQTKFDKLKHVTEWLSYEEIAKMLEGTLNLQGNPYTTEAVKEWIEDNEPLFSQKRERKIDRKALGLGRGASWCYEYPPAVIYSYAVYQQQQLTQRNWAKFEKAISVVLELGADMLGANKSTWESLDIGEANKVKGLVWETILRGRGETTKRTGVDTVALLEDVKRLNQHIIELVEDVKNKDIMLDVSINYIPAIRTSLGRLQTTRGIIENATADTVNHNTMCALAVELGFNGPQLSHADIPYTKEMFDTKPCRIQVKNPKDKDYSWAYPRECWEHYDIAIIG